MNRELNVAIRIVIATLLIFVPVMLTMVWVFWVVVFGWWWDVPWTNPRSFWHKLYKWVREPIDGYQI
ncbi:MAG: hypothetical protein ABIP81_01385 [Terriglobales bacterium]